MALQIHLEQITVEPQSKSHPDIPDNSKLFAQLIIGEIIFLQTLQFEKMSDPDSEQISWKLQVDSMIPPGVPDFSIMILHISPRQCIRLLGTAKITQEDVMQEDKCLSMMLVNVTQDGPELLLKPKCSVASTNSDSTFAGTTLIKDYIISLDQVWIEGTLRHMLQFIQSAPPNQQIDPLDLAVMHQRILLLPSSHKSKAQYLDMLGDIYSKSHRSFVIQNLHHAADVYHDAVREALLDDPSLTVYLFDVGKCIFNRFKQLGDISDINEAILRLQQAEQLTPDDHAAKWYLLHYMGNALLERFERFSQIDDIKECVQRFQKAVELIPDGYAEKWLLLKNLGGALIYQYECFGDIEDLSKSILITQESIELIPDDHSQKPSLLNNLSISFLKRFQKLDSLSDLNQSIQEAEKAVQLSTNDNPLKPSFLDSLVNALYDHFVKLGDWNDFNMAILKQEEAVQLTPHGDLSRLSLSDNHARSLFLYFHHFKDHKDLDKAIQIFEEASQHIPDGHRNKPISLNGLGHSLLYRCKHYGDPNDAIQSVAKFKKALQLIPDGHSDKPIYLTDLGHAQQYCFTSLGNQIDLQNAICNLKEAVQLTPDSDSRKPERVIALSLSLYYGFRHFGNIDDINLSIKSLHDAIHLIGDGDPKTLVGCLNNLGMSLCEHFMYFGDDDDLHQSLSKLNTALKMVNDNPKLTEEDVFLEPNILTNLGKAHTQFFQHFNDLNSLKESLLNYKAAVELTSDSYSLKPAFLCNLGLSLLNNFDEFGDINDINESIVKLNNAVQLASETNPEKFIIMMYLAVSYISRFKQFGDLDDINYSITKLQDALKLMPPNHPEHATILSNICLALHLRFDLLGDLSDVNEAISSGQKAIQLSITSSSHMHTRLNTLGAAFLGRFRWFSDLSDLNEALVTFQQALQFTPDGHSLKSARLGNLCTVLLYRFERFGDVNDINEAVLHLQNVLQVMPDAHPQKPWHLNHLAKALNSRFARFGDIEDIDKGILGIRDSLRISSVDHADRHSWLENLGGLLALRFQMLHNINDLSESLTTLQEARKVMPINHFHQAGLLVQSACVSMLHYNALHNAKDLTQAFELISSAAFAEMGPTAIRFDASYQLAYWAEEYQNLTNIDPSFCIQAYSQALFLLPQLAWPGSPLIDRYFHIRKAGDVVRHAAAAALHANDPTTAVQWLEQGRSVIWGQLLQLCTPFSDLKVSYPEYDAKLMYLSAQLEEATNYDISPLLLPVSGSRPGSLLQVSTSSKGITKDYHQLAYDREQLIASIRQLPGFEQFLLPKQLSELSRATALGTIIILNASERSCDALAVTSQGNNVIHIPLPDMSLNKATAINKVLQDLLRGHVPASSDLLAINTDRLGIMLVIPDTLSHLSHEETLDQSFQKFILTPLWDWIIKPVIKRLELTTTKLCRIWWCPTGVFSFLPLHAAGDYSQNALPGSKLTDYVISSYTPSLSALLHALDSSPSIPTSPQMLLVAQSHSSGQASLPGTQEELKLIQKYAREDIKMIQVSESLATIDKVKEEMQNTNWVHFACHGVQNLKEPTASALLLAGSMRLTLSEIITMHLPSKDFAFLSACQTATGDEELSEEAVHLAAGMLSAGYRGVIATMWSINDWHAPQVADDVYGHLFKDAKPDSRKAAEALHYATKNLQMKGVSFVHWVPFIHMGL